MNDSKNKAELYKALGYDDSEDSGMMNYSLMPKDFIQMEIGVGLKKFSVALAEDMGRFCRIILIFTDHSSVFCLTFKNGD